MRPLRVHHTTHATILIAFSLSIVAPSRVLALTPNSPAVQQSIQRGLAWLGKASPHGQLGGKCLVGLVFLKAGQPDHESVRDAVEACKRLESEGVKAIREYRELYSIGLSIVFLCELDPVLHRKTIETFLDGLFKRQRDFEKKGQNGGFGYRNRQTGDTSMTQYAVLAIWTAHRSGISVPSENVKDVCEWLLRTQDPSGAWGYQGKDPGPNSNLVKQREIRSSMVAAGLGSVYMLSDVMGLNRMLSKVSDEIPDIPPALKLVPIAAAAPIKGVASSGLATRVKRAAKAGDAWFEKHFEAWPEEYPYYFLYALERSHSFRELAWNLDDKEPEWYAKGFEALSKQQTADGGWTASNNSDARIDSAFAMLFLMRGTKKSIQRSLGSGSGMLVGGRGLPRDLSSVRVQSGRIVNSEITVPTLDLLDTLEAPDHPDLDRMLEDSSLILIRGSAEQQREQALRFRRLVKADDYRVRRLSVRALASYRDLDSVPQLIYAITDPDDTVSSDARTGLRYISRNLLGVSDERTPNEKEKINISNQWKEWYSTIRPNAQYLK